MNVIWRFYVDQQGSWRWQQIAVHGVVTAESSSGHPTYGDCLAAAHVYGYRYEASQTASPRVRHWERRP